MKKLFTLLCVALFAVTADAQNDMAVTIPDYNDFVSVNTEGLNVRKAPSATSPKMMAWYSDGGFSGTQTKYYFEGENSSKYRANSRTGAYVEAVHPFKDDLLPVIGESGDWYKVAIEYYGGFEDGHKSKTGYIMKRYCTKHSLMTLTTPFTYEYDHNEVKEYSFPVTNRTTGAYTNVKFAVGNVLEGDEGYATTVFIPLLAGNRFVCMQRVQLSVRNSTSNTYKLTFKKEQEENMMTGEMETWTDITLYMPKVNGSDMQNKIISGLKALSDSYFVQLVNEACAEPRDVYGKLDNGKIFAISLTSNSDIPNTPYSLNANRKPGKGFSFQKVGK